ncbi:acid protease [Stipitochalara longipes BDJ]|nr:acid protease [Stipitochalara longipes BDJ]
MKPSSIVTSFLCVTLYLSECLLAAKPVGFKVTRALPNSGASLARRDYVAETLNNNLTVGGYLASVQVGTPSQTLLLMVSTGSSDIWVIDSSSNICAQSCLTPFYSKKSTSLQIVSAGGFDISYEDGTGAKGDYIRDEFLFGQVGHSMQMQIGLVNNTQDSVGVMGIGYDTNEATTVQYQNFMDEMVSDGLTNTKLYSLWLNDLGSGTGSILFGGIDTEKYYGTLSSMPTIAKNGKYTDFSVGLTSISYTPGSTAIPLTNSSFSAAVILESSTTEIYLPETVVSSIYSAFGVEIGSDKSPYVDCKTGNSSYMSFGFESGTVIDVPYSEFITKLYVPNPLPKNLTFSDVCSFGIWSSGSGDNLLGDFFLRSAYVVYDLTNNHIWMAPAVLNSTKSNVVEIQAGAVSLPQSTGVTRPSPTTSSSTTPTSPTGTSTTSAPPAPPKNNHAVAIGVGVAVPLGVALAAIIGFCLWRRRRNRRGQPQPEKVPGQQIQPVTIPELGDSAYINAGAVYKDGRNDAGQGRMSQMSSTPSELSAGTPLSSPRSPVERKPVPARDELPTTWEHGDGPLSP